MPTPGYLRFARANARFLGFGFTIAFASSVGQTFFIGVFGPAVRGEFGLSHTSWSAIYMAGTLLSAVALTWTGPQIDRLPLKRYVTLVGIALVVAAAFMAQVPSAAWLVLAIFLLRQAGQGLASHVATTSMARYFHADRGKAVAIAALGFAAGESMLPVAAVIGIAVLGWRASYGVAAVVLALGLLPTLWWLLRHHDARHRDHVARLAHPAPQASQAPGPATPGATPGTAPGTAPGATRGRSWSRAEVLRHRTFYLLLPAVLAPSFVSTALFFHHLELAAVKGWSAAWITGNYWVFALGAVCASLASGPLIDRVTAVRVLPAFLLPMALGLLVLWGFESALWALPYLFLLGLTSGIAHTAIAALWAEIYGVQHLGAVRSLVMSLSVLASALGPLTMGAMMDAGVSVEAICGLFALYCLAATGLLALGLRGLK
jgi:MFS family permease